MATTLADDYATHVATVAARYDAALEAADIDRVIVFAGLERMRPFDDSAYPFSATAHYRAWVPLHAPGHAVVYVRGERPRLFCYQPRDFWHAAPDVPPAMVQAAFDVITAGAVDDLVRQLGDGGKTAFLGEADQVPEVCAHLDLNPPALVRRLNYARTVKTAYEIRCLGKANEAGARAHRAAADAFREGASEYEIHQRYLQAIDATDADLPYHSIVALNEHGAILHYQLRERAAPCELRTFLIDAGAMVAGYGSDITRTYLADSADAAPFADLLDAMDALQLALCEQVRPGLAYVDLHLDCHHRLAKVLLAAGLIRDVSAEGAVATGITRTFFPHGLGHFLGLQVHDVAGFQHEPEGARVAPPDEHPFLRLTRTLQKNEVVTIEPGLYFIPMLLDALRASDAGQHVNWSLVQTLTPYGGIRIEDDVVATDQGPRNLTREAFAA